VSNTNEPELSSATLRLITLAQRSLGGDAPKRDGASLPRVQRALEKGAPQRRVVGSWGARAVVLDGLASLFSCGFDLLSSLLEAMGQLDLLEGDRTRRRAATRPSPGADARTRDRRWATDKDVPSTTTCRPTLTPTSLSSSMLVTKRPG